VVNGVPVAEGWFEGKEPFRLEAEVPAGALREGENVLSVENVGDTGASYSMVMLERFEVEYPRRLVAEDGSLEGIFRESGEAAIAGVSGARILDVTDTRPRWLRGAEATASGSRLSVEAGRRYLLVSAEAVKRPGIRSPVQSRLKRGTNQADYLMIGPRDLLEAAAPLLDLRRRQGLSSQAAALEEIDSEFGFGESNPRAIREFLSYAYHHWRKPAPRYVVLVGDATYDFKDYLDTGVANRVPPMMEKTSYMWTASDAAYGAVNGADPLTDVAIGRLPAASVGELRVMVSKLLEYEALGGTSAGASVLIADNPDSGGDFESNAEEIADTLLASRDTRRIYLRSLGTEATRQAIVGAFDDGPALVSYLGHGGIHLWASENLFDSSRVGTLVSQPEQPLVLTMNCLNGYFHFPYFNSLAEELVKAEGKGAIAAISPTGMSLNDPAHQYHKALLSELLAGRHQRLGDAFMAAQSAYAATGAFPELLRIYHLFGDPALSLR
jgi:Peptidase family C25